MRSNTARAAIGIALVVIATALFFVLRESEDDNKSPSSVAAPSDQGQGPNGDGNNPAPPQPPPVETIVVSGGEPAGGVVDLEFTQGETARFRVRSDVADEVHLHGYDISKPVSAGGTVTFSFPAEITGVFELELEESAVPIAELSITPG